MDHYSYSKEIKRNNVAFREMDLDGIKNVFTYIFGVYSPKIKAERFDSFCEDFFDLIKEVPASNERVWRMVVTDMLFSYDDRGYLEAATEDNAMKRRQFAIIAKAIISKLRV